jgi:hypothetical protein
MLLKQLDGALVDLTSLVSILPTCSQDSSKGSAGSVETYARMATVSTVDVAAARHGRRPSNVPRTADVCPRPTPG